MFIAKRSQSCALVNVSLFQTTSNMEPEGVWWLFFSAMYNISSASVQIIMAAQALVYVARGEQSPECLHAFSKRCWLTNHNIKLSHRIPMVGSCSSSFSSISTGRVPADHSLQLITLNIQILKAELSPQWDSYPSSRLNRDREPHLTSLHGNLGNWSNV
jgi:hypothetical protein